MVKASYMIKCNIYEFSILKKGEPHICICTHTYTHIHMHTDRHSKNLCYVASYIHNYTGRKMHI